MVALLTLAARVVVHGLQARAAAAYSAAGSVAQQTLGNMRTVATYGQERAMLQQYDAALEGTAKARARVCVWEAATQRCVWRGGEGQR